MWDGSSVKAARMVSGDIIRIDYSQFHEFHRISTEEWNRRYTRPPPRPEKLDPYANITSKWMSNLKNIDTDELKKQQEQNFRTSPTKKSGSPTIRKRPVKRSGSRENFIMINENPKADNGKKEVHTGTTKDPNSNEKSMLDRFYGSNVSDINISNLDLSTAKTYDSLVNARSQLMGDKK